MRIALIADTHAGRQNDSEYVLQNQSKFYEQIFFPTLEARGIKTVFHLGDLFDRRKYINFKTLETTKKSLLDPLYRYDTYIIAGNHDVFYRDTNALNSLDQLLQGYRGIKVVKHPEEFQFGGLDMLFLPWINRENQPDSFQLIKKSDAKAVFGHLQLVGFEMHAGHFATDGLPKELFEKFRFVASGHFHKRSTYGNIHYLGCPTQLDWNDYGEVKGFHIFDTETFQLEFIPNPFELYQKIYYDDGVVSEHSDIFGTYVKVIVMNKGNATLFEDFITDLETKNPAKLSIDVTPQTVMLYDGDEEELLEADTTIDIITKASGKLAIDERYKPRLEILFRDLYKDVTIGRI